MLRYTGAVAQWQTPESGAIIVINHEVLRVIEVNLVPEEDWTAEERQKVAVYKPEVQVKVSPAHLIARPIGITSDDVRARDFDRHYRVKAGAGYSWNVYPNEHYPVCSRCHEPMPCREENGRRQAEAAIEKMSRYENPAVCPVCLEPFTRRQKTHRFDENLEIPAGPAVTFHLRGGCFSGAYQYEKRLAKANPGYVPALFCPGFVTNHNDGTYECTAGDRCGGPGLNHEGYQSCDCGPCTASGQFDCHPMAWAIRRDAT